MRNYPTIFASFTIIAVLLSIAFYAMVSIPYGEAALLWRGAEAIWEDTPRLAAPIWFNAFRSEKLSETISLKREDATITEEAVSATIRQETWVFAYDFPYASLPTEIKVFFTVSADDKAPMVTLTWVKPDGTSYQLTTMTVGDGDRYSISADSKFSREQLGGENVSSTLYRTADSTAEDPEILNGTYQLIASVYHFTDNSEIEIQFVNFGEVYGIAGTDHLRRDLRIGLLWGTPFALMFGLLGAVGSTSVTFLIAAIGTWYGGFLDAAIQRICEVRLQLPTLPILIMLGTFYSRSIFLMLGVIIALDIFSSGIKTYRAMFMQVKNLPYIEAARAYGASNMRIIVRYMIPKVAPVLIPNFVTLIPSFVFLEASLAVLNLGDPTAPTWGKILNDAYRNGALYRGYYYWVLEPAVLLMFTGLAFSMLGFALDRIFNPRLRRV